MSQRYINSSKLIAQAIYEQPDLLLIDLWMPVLQGDRLTRMIKSTPEVKHISVILFSASIDGSIIAKQAGADKFVEKPFNVENLAIIIISVLL